MTKTIEIVLRRLSVKAKVKEKNFNLGEVENINIFPSRDFEKIGPCLILWYINKEYYKKNLKELEDFSEEISVESNLIYENPKYNNLEIKEIYNFKEVPIMGRSGFRMFLKKKYEMKFF